MDNEVWFNGVFGLIGAVIGGAASLKATNIQLKKQDYQNKINERKNEDLIKAATEEKRVLTKNMIETFLINEIAYNLEKTRWIEPYLNEGYGSPSHKSAYAEFEYKMNEYNEVKFKLLEITTIETLIVVKIYQMFYMLSNTQTDYHLKRFNEKEFNFIVDAYILANKFVNSYFDKMLRHYGGEK